MTNRPRRLAMLALSIALFGLAGFPGGLGAPPSDTPGQGQAVGGNETQPSPPPTLTVATSPSPSFVPRGRTVDMTWYARPVVYVYRPVVTVVVSEFEGAEAYYILEEPVVRISRLHGEELVFPALHYRPVSPVLIVRTHHHDDAACDQEDRSTDQNP